MAIMICDNSGKVIPDDLPDSPTRDEVVKEARRIARDRGKTVLLHDDDVTWVVTPFGIIERID